MTNRVCELLGCRYPILEGGLAYVGNGRLAAAVSNGGGFGQVGSGGRSPEDFEAQIRIAVSESSGAIGVNIPISEHRDPSAYLDVVQRHAGRLRAVSLSAGNPRPFVEPLKSLGLVVMTLASSPAQALKAEAAGADLVICEGTEAGGHNGPAELTTMVLIPAVVQAIQIPVIAAGGIADGHTAAAAFCLGAEGVQLGTRFVATVECQAHDDYKQAIVAAGPEATTVMERSFGRVTRVLKSSFVERILAQEKETPGSFEDLWPMIQGQKNKVAAIEGQLAEGWLNCGQSAGLVADILPAGAVVQQTMAELESCLAERLGFIKATLNH